MEPSQLNGADIEAGHVGNDATVMTHGGGAGAGADGATKDKRNISRPATMSEWLLRLGLTGNIALQTLNILKTSSASSWSSLTTAGRVGRALIYASSGFGVLQTPVVLYKERKLTNEDTFRVALNGIRDEQARLAEKNEELSCEVDDLQDEVDRMKEVEMALRELTATQGTQLSELMNLIKKNQEINEDMRSVLKAKCLEDIVSLVLDMDNDGSFKIEANEIDRLIIGIKLIEGISFDAVSFRQEIINCDGCVEEVITLVKGMLNGNETKCKIEVVDSEQFFRKQKNKRR